MILPFPAPQPGHVEALQPEDIEALQAFVAAQPDRFRAPYQRPTCERDGHRPAARWRGAELRCFRCQRCGQETQP